MDRTTATERPNLGGYRPKPSQPTGNPATPSRSAKKRGLARSMGYLGMVMRQEAIRRMQQIDPHGCPTLHSLRIL